MSLGKRDAAIVLLVRRTLHLWRPVRAMTPSVCWSFDSKAPARRADLSLLCSHMLKESFHGYVEGCPDAAFRISRRKQAKHLSGRVLLEISAFGVSERTERLSSS